MSAISALFKNSASFFFSINSLSKKQKYLNKSLLLTEDRTAIVSRKHLYGNKIGLNACIANFKPSKFWFKCPFSKLFLLFCFFFVSHERELEGEQHNKIKEWSRLLKDLAWYVNETASIF